MDPVLVLRLKSTFVQMGTFDIPWRTDGVADLSLWIWHWLLSFSCSLKPLLSSSDVSTAAAIRPHLNPCSPQVLRRHPLWPRPHSLPMRQTVHMIPPVIHVCCLHGAQTWTCLQYRAAAAEPGKLVLCLPSISPLLSVCACSTVPVDFSLTK